MITNNFSLETMDHNFQRQSSTFRALIKSTLHSMSLIRGKHRDDRKTKPRCVLSSHEHRDYDFSLQVSFNSKAKLTDWLFSFGADNGPLVLQVVVLVCRRFVTAKLIISPYYLEPPRPVKRQMEFTHLNILF
ncbi:hypothetical protein ABKN59_006362 [Abortiporus biennis]